MQMWLQMWLQVWFQMGEGVRTSGMKSIPTDQMIREPFENFDSYLDEKRPPS
jgi:hypothetical protein